MKLTKKLYFFLLPLIFSSLSSQAAVLDYLQPEVVELLARAQSQNYYEVRFLEKEINGIPRLAVLLGETHARTSNEAVIGTEILKQFSYVGIENFRIRNTWGGRYAAAFVDFSMYCVKKIYPSRSCSSTIDDHCLTTLAESLAQLVFSGLEQYLSHWNTQKFKSDVIPNKIAIALVDLNQITHLKPKPGVFCIYIKDDPFLDAVFSSLGVNIDSLPNKTLGLSTIKSILEKLSEDSALSSKTRGKALELKRDLEEVHHDISLPDGTIIFEDPSFEGGESAPRTIQPIKPSQQSRRTIDLEEEHQFSILENVYSLYFLSKPICTVVAVGA